MNLVWEKKMDEEELYEGTLIEYLICSPSTCISTKNMFQTDGWMAESNQNSKIPCENAQRDITSKVERVGICSKLDAYTPVLYPYFD